MAWVADTVVDIAPRIPLRSLRDPAARTFRV